MRINVTDIHTSEMNTNKTTEMRGFMPITDMQSETAEESAKNLKGKSLPFIASIAVAMIKAANISGKKSSKTRSICIPPFLCTLPDCCHPVCYSVNFDVPVFFEQLKIQRF